MTEERVESTRGTGEGLDGADRKASVSGRGAAHWDRGHPWIYRSDVRSPPEPDRPGVVAVTGPGGRPLGSALWSPGSEIQLRRLAGPEEAVDAAWWRARIAAAHARRGAVDGDAWRVVHGEADGLPSLVVDRYGPVAVVQLLSAGLEAFRTEVLDAVDAVLAPEGILLRNDAGVRRHEGLPLVVEVARGTVPDRLVVREGAVRYEVDLRGGQKTGAFLDQRANRMRAGRLMADLLAARLAGAAGGEGSETAAAVTPVRALDAFSYHGSFALHMAAAGSDSEAGRTPAATIVAVDQSAEALARGAANLALNGLAGVRWVEANAFDFLAQEDRAGARYDLVVLDPPAFAKRRASVAAALRGYGEINRRGLRILAPGGLLLTFSCSFHLGLAAFLNMLAEAAADAGRRVALEAVLGPAPDHPEILTIPETRYLKGARLRALE